MCLFNLLKDQVECDPNRHTVAQWCGIKGQVQDMIDAGTNPATGQLSPGIWMNNCVKSKAYPTGNFYACTPSSAMVLLLSSLFFSCFVFFFPSFLLFLLWLKMSKIDYYSVCPNVPFFKMYIYIVCLFVFVLEMGRVQQILNSTRAMNMITDLRAWCVWCFADDAQ